MHEAAEASLAQLGRWSRCGLQESCASMSLSSISVDSTHRIQTINKILSVQNVDRLFSFHYSLNDTDNNCLHSIVLGIISHAE